MENLFLFIINIEKKTYNVYNTIEQMKKWEEWNSIWQLKIKMYGYCYYLYYVDWY